MKIRILTQTEAANIEPVKIVSDEPTYNAVYAQWVVKNFYSKFPETQASAEHFAERERWELFVSDYAEQFIKEVKRHNPIGIMYIYYLFEACNYHNINRDFINGYAADYIE